MDQKDQVLKTLRGIKLEIGDRYKVDNIGLFGSFVRSEEKEESDIDILLEFEQGADLLDLVALGDFLEERLGEEAE